MSQKVILTDEQIHLAIDHAIDYLEHFEDNISHTLKEWKLATKLKESQSILDVLEYKIKRQRAAGMRSLDLFYHLASYTVTDELDRDGHPTGSSTFYCRDLTNEQFFEIQRLIEGFIGADEPLAPFSLPPSTPGNIQKILGDRYDKL